MSLPARTTDQLQRHRTPLVEREGLAELVTSALLAPASGRGAGVLIAGETGTGKSALIAAAIDAAGGTDRNGRSYIQITCHPAGIPYAPWLALIESLPGLQAVLPPPLGAQEPAARGPGELIHQAANAICAQRDARPAALIFDDLQWADAASLDLMLAVARQIHDREAPMALILACETPLREGSPVASFVPALVRETPAETVELRPLSADGVRSMVHSQMAHPPDEGLDELVERIARWSGGNPLYVAEIIESIDRDSDRLATDDQWWDSLSFSLRQLAEHRLAQVSEQTRETLEFAALVSESIEIDLLREISGFDMERLVADLEEALDRGMLVEERGGELRFRHGLLRQTLSERQSSLRRRRRHRSVFDALRQRPRAQPRDLAYHAEAAGEHRAAVQALEAAAQQAREFFDMAEAGRALRQALNLANQAHLDDGEQDELRLRFADAIVRQDPSASAREIERVAARAFVRNDQLRLGRARQRQSTLLYESGRQAEALAILDGLLPELREQEDWESLAEALTCALYCAATASDFAKVDQLAGELVELTDDLASPGHRAVAHQMRAIASVARGAPAGAPLAGRNALTMAVELGQLDIATSWAVVVFFRIDLFANLHRPDEVAALIERGLELDRESNRRIGLPPDECDCTPEFTYWWMLRGEWDRVERELPDPLEARAAAVPQVRKDSIQVIAAELAFGRGRLSEATSLLAYVAPGPDTTPGNHGYQQWLMAVELHVRAALASNNKDAAAAWIVALDRELESKPHLPGELLLALSRARLHLAENEAEEALSLAGEVVNRARQTQNMLAVIDALQLQARARLLLGADETAIGAADAAVATAAQCGLDYIEALARITRLEIAQAVGDNPGALRAEAERLIRQLEGLETQPALERLRKFSAPRGSYFPAGLTQREMEVLHLVAEGKTDNEVADLLFISPRTVSTHVSNMFNKTGVNNRVELTNWAHQHNALD